MRLNMLHITSSNASQLKLLQDVTIDKNHLVFSYFNLLNQCAYIRMLVGKKTLTSKKPR